MTKRPLVIITTELPPAMCGIGTYSWLLRTHWPNEWSRIEFLVNKKSTADPTTPAGDRVTCFNGDPKELAAGLDRIGAADLLLHYTGRSYQSLGLPRWMPRALGRWKRKFSGSRIMIVVHELPAQFPITSPHFWLAKLGDRIIAQLSRIGDVLVTNSPHHAQRLREVSARADVHFIPNPSNIEVTSGDGNPRAPGEFVIFGLSFGRLQTLRQFQSHLESWRKSGLLRKLHLIGPNDDEFARESEKLVDPAIVMPHGKLPGAEIAILLRRASFALTNASETTWSQSTTFMACAGSECPMVVATPRSGAGPFACTIGVDEVATISPDELARRTSALADWYRANATWPVIAARMAALWPNES